MTSHIESFQIHLSSKTADRIIDGNNCDVEFNLPTIEIPSNYHIYASVVHAIIPYTFYNVNETNNYFVLCYGGSAYTGTTATFINFTIPVGNYNVFNLRDTLASNLPDFNITYNTINNTFTINRKDGVTFAFFSNTPSLDLIGVDNSKFPSQQLSITSNKAVNLSPIRCICINTNLKTNNINKANVNNHSILCSIPIATQPYSIITYVNNSNFKCNTFTNVLNNIAIKLTDQNGNLLNLNGVNWSMTLQFDIVDFVSND